MNPIHIARIKDFERQLQKLHLRGGRPQRIAKKVTEMYGAATMDPVRGLSQYQITKHGESRLRHCKKYDIGDGYRLVTVQTDGCIFFCFVGDHAEVEHWLDRHRGLEFTVDGEGHVEYVRSSFDIESPKRRIVTDTDYAKGLLFERLPQERLDDLTAGIPASIIRALVRLDTTASDDEVQEVALGILDEKQATAVFDVLMLLRDGNVAEAERRVDLYVGASRAIDSLSEEEMVEIRDGETVKLVPLGSPEYLALLDQLMRGASYHEWMLFLHPEQQRIVKRDFDGPAKLSGVSGSGKTSIVVKRAVRLAGETGGRPVLVLTLNRSLAMLIRRLVEYAAPSDEIRSRVHVKSLFELCQELLRRFEPKNEKNYHDVTWKNEEHIDEIWREYYRCLNNNNDAVVLFEIHKSLSVRRISGEIYLRQEFDWLRSAFRSAEREAYLQVERSGRAVTFLEHWRSAVLKGLQGWEDKMRFVGVTDHLGLACSLEPHLDQIEPEYSAVLVDEVQDFGTIELAIARRLVAPGKNDVFLCGDLVQCVQAKHQSLQGAGIKVPGSRSLTIRRTIATAGRSCVLPTRSSRRQYRTSRRSQERSSY